MKLQEKKHSIFIFSDISGKMGDREFRDIERKLKRTPKKEDSTSEDVTQEKRNPANHPPGKMTDPYSHPVYNEISYINGQINRMDLFQVIISLFCVKEARLTKKPEAAYNYPTSNERLNEHINVMY